MEPIDTSAWEVEAERAKVDRAAVVAGGPYLLEVKNVEVATSQAGNQMIVCRYEVQDQEWSQHVYDRLVLTPRAFFHIKRVHKALGKPTPPPQWVPNPLEYQGAKLVAKLRLGKPYTNKETGEVNQSVEVDWDGDGGFAPRPPKGAVAPQTAAAFDVTMTATPTVTPATAPAPQADAVFDDDIPF